MYKYRCEFRSKLPVSALWPTLLDMARWPDVEPRLVSINIQPPLAVGTRFEIQWKVTRPFGPRSARIVELSPSRSIAFKFRVPLATITRKFEVREDPTGSRFIASLNVFGPPLWTKVVAADHAAGLSDIVPAYIAAAHARSAGRRRPPGGCSEEEMRACGIQRVFE